jgi:hypothetical protein
LAPATETKRGRGRRLWRRRRQVEVENGHRDPGFHTMLKWARALGHAGSLDLFSSGR